MLGGYSSCSKSVQNKVTLQGIFRAHKSGFGFVTIDEEEDDLFVSVTMLTLLSKVIELRLQLKRLQIVSRELPQKRKSLIFWNIA